MHGMTRREFFRESFGLLIGASMLKNFKFSSPFQSTSAQSSSLLVSARNGTPEELLNAALQKWGGIEKVISRGQKVVIKVNMSWNVSPEQVATTTPELVEALVKLCRGAGASEVLVIDHTIDNPEMCMDTTGLEEAVEKAKGKIRAMNSHKDYEMVKIKKGNTLIEAEVSKAVLDADVFINVPIAKVHNSATVTLSMKNLMGIVWDRSAFHWKGLHDCIAELSTTVKPDLIILDAYRVLMTQGPRGPGRIKEAGEIVVGVDPVAVDVYGSSLLEKDYTKVRHIVKAADLGVGQIDMDKINILYVDAQGEPVETSTEPPQPTETEQPSEPRAPDEELTKTEPPLTIPGEEPEDTEEKEVGIPPLILIPALVVAFLIGLRMRRKKEDAA